MATVAPRLTAPPSAEASSPTSAPRLQGPPAPPPPPPPHLRHTLPLADWDPTLLLLLLVIRCLPVVAFRLRLGAPPLPARALPPRRAPAAPALGPPVIADLTKLRRVPHSLVAEVLTARPPPPPPLALPFFLWAGRQKGFRHCFPAFHALASLLSAAGLPAAADQLPDLMRAHGRPVSTPAAHAPRPAPHRRAPPAPRSPRPPPLPPRVRRQTRGPLVQTRPWCVGRRGHVEDALKLFDEMAETETRPMPVTFAIMVCALAHAGMTERLLEMIERMRNEGVEGNGEGWGGSGRNGICKMVGGLCKGGMVEEAAELFKEMRKKGLLVDRMVYASLIDGYVSTGMVGDGCRVLKEMIDAGYRAELEIYNTLISGLCSIGREDKAQKMFQIVLQEELMPSSDTVSPLLACYAEKDELVMFLGLVDKLAELDLPVVEFLVFMKLFAGKDGRELKAVEVFDALKRKQYCSVGIYNSVIENLLKIKERNKALLLFEEMQSSVHYKPDSCTYSHMIPCFVDEGNVEEACSSKSPEKVISVVEEIIEVGCSMEDILYSAIIYGFCKYASSTEAGQVFTIMRDRNILSEANFIVYEEMLNEHLKKVTADLVVSGLKLFDLESKLKWTSRID
ncbi:hypothetical protein HU200_067043 [Digitaria exilis]|uniref:Pentatricopeptide repeat-containing protein n=1 Tax=Digitaria exilis TaxID=1010633 RepID=A0A835A5P3_9POAL|nr:hypothetical protein HU200_067043 [Digitaria exilis]